MVCSDGEVALVDDGGGLGMRVDVCKEGVWGVVSGANWNNLAAEVVCRNASSIKTSSEGIYKYVCLLKRPLFKIKFKDTWMG